jgi:hypothetical protein
VGDWVVQILWWWWKEKQVAKARGYATCMVFGEGGRFVYDVGTRFRSHYLEILLV